MLNKGTSCFLNSQLLVWSRLIIVIDKWLSYSFFWGGGGCLAIKSAQPKGFSRLLKHSGYGWQRYSLCHISLSLSFSGMKIVYYVNNHDFIGSKYDFLGLLESTIHLVAVFTWFQFETNLWMNLLWLNYF